MIFTVRQAYRKFIHTSATRKNSGQKLRQCKYAGGNLPSQLPVYVVQIPLPARGLSDVLQAAVNHMLYTAFYAFSLRYGHGHPIERQSYCHSVACRINSSRCVASGGAIRSIKPSARLSSSRSKISLARTRFLPGEC